MLHVIPLKDRVQLLYGIDFNQETDVSLTRIFLQELQEAKRHVRNCIDAKIYIDIRVPRHQFRHLPVLRRAFVKCKERRFYAA